MSKRTKKRPPGPKPDHLTLDGQWTKAVKRALAKKRPKRGWPTPKKK